MILNEIGRIVHFWKNEIAHYYCGVTVDDAFVIMPNHIHIIIWIHDVGADRCVCPIKTDVYPIRQNDPNIPEIMAGRCIFGRGTHIGVPLPKIVQWFKTMTTNSYFRTMKSNIVKFGNRLWQRNYYERVIRSESELNCIREYIRKNPSNWENDAENQ